jgi:hypothetical protein
MSILGYTSLATVLFSFIGIGVMLKDTKTSKSSTTITLLLNAIVLFFIIKAMVALGLF